MLGKFISVDARGGVDITYIRWPGYVADNLCGCSAGLVALVPAALQSISNHGSFPGTGERAYEV